MIYSNTYERKWYISCQDGRVDNQEFDTEEEAIYEHEKLKDINYNEYRATSVSFYDIERKGKL